MGKKAGASTGAKTKAPAGKKAGQASSCRGAQTSGKAAAVEERSMVELRAESAVLRARRSRQDLEVRAERAVKDKFQNFDPIVINTRRRKTDQKTIQECVEDELRRIGDSGKYISTAFWTKITGEFDLGSPLFSNLPEIEEDGDPDPELLETLAVAHGKSKAVRSTEGFESFLRHARPLDKTTLIITLGECRESPVLPRSMSHVMCMAVLGHIGKHGLDTEIPDVWKVIEEPMEGILVETVQGMAAKNLKRKFILAGLQDQLRLYFDKAVVSRVETALGNQVDPAPGDVSALMGTKVGVELYKSEAATMRYSMFVRSCEQRLADLEHNNFDAAEIQGFQNIMAREVEELAVFGFKSYQRKESKQDFLRQPLSVTVMSTQDDYWFRFLGRVKSIGVNTQMLPRLPWEVLLFGNDKPIEGISMAVHVPMEYLQQNFNAREACIDLMPKNIQLTFQEMVDDTRKHETALKDLCKDFVQELAFLRQKAQELGVEICSARVVEHMPNQPGHLDVKLDAALELIRKEARSGLAIACGPTFKRELNDVVEFLSMVQEGKGPADVSSFTSPLLVQILGRAELFYQVKVPAPGGLFGAKRLVGSDAAKRDFADFKATLADGGDIGPLAERLRQYQWLLRPQEQDELDAAVKERVKRRSQELLKPKALEDGEADGEADAPGGKRAKTSTKPAGGPLKFGTFLVPPTPAAKAGKGGNSLPANASRKDVEAKQGSPEDYKASLRSLFKAKKASK